MLVTAFGRFEDGDNCSEMVLDALRSRSEEVSVAFGGRASFRRFDVDTVAIGPAFAATMRLARPSHILMMGQASSRTGLSLERAACNEIDLRVPDAAGRIGALGSVLARGADRLSATWPDLEGAAAAMSGAGAATWLSDDAGRHLCNQTLYLALAAAGRARRPVAATFLHIPLLAEQIAAGVPAAAHAPEGPAPTVTDVARAILALLGHTRMIEGRG